MADSPAPQGSLTAVLPTGERIEVVMAAEGGYGYSVSLSGRRFGAYDTAWSADQAYEQAVNAARSKRPRAGSLPTPRFSFVETEDPDCFGVCLAPSLEPMGWVCRRPLGWGYRVSELMPWIEGASTRRLAAIALLGRES